MGWGVGGGPLLLSFWVYYCYVELCKVLGDFGNHYNADMVWSSLCV